LYLALSLLFAPILVRKVLKGHGEGRAGPMIDGFYRSYDREQQPRRFWFSMIWNGVWAIVFSAAVPIFVWNLI
jgi:hypothetical protein